MRDFHASAPPDAGHDRRGEKPANPRNQQGICYATCTLVGRSPDGDPRAGLPRFSRRGTREGGSGRPEQEADAPAGCVDPVGAGLAAATLPSFVAAHLRLWAIREWPFGRGSDWLNPMQKELVLWLSCRFIGIADIFSRKQHVRAA